MSGKNSDLPVRLGAALAMIGGALVALWFGGVVFWLLITVGALLMLSEWAGLVDAKPQRRIAQYALTVPLALMAPAWLAMGPSWFVFGLIIGAAFFVAAITPPIKPAQVLFGLIEGASLGPPIARPAK